MTPTSRASRATTPSSGPGADHLDGGADLDFGDGGTDTDACVDLEDLVSCESEPHPLPDPTSQIRRRRRVPRGGSCCPFERAERHPYDRSNGFAYPRDSARQRRRCPARCRDRRPVPVVGGSGQRRDLDWVRRQNAVTEAHLARLPVRLWFQRTMQAIVARPRAGVPRRAAGRYVVNRNDGHQNQDVWYLAASLDELRAGGRVLIDPNTFSVDGTDSLVGLEISPDGRPCPVRGLRGRKRLAQPPGPRRQHRRGHRRRADPDQVLDPLLAA